MTVVNLRARLDALEARRKPLDFDQIAAEFAASDDWRSNLDEVEAEHKRREGRDLLPEEIEWFAAFAARIVDLRAKYEAPQPRRTV